MSDTAAKGGWKLHGRFQSDPWGDPYNTVGLQISTKKKGAISDTCLCGTDLQTAEACPDGEASKDCSSDLDDVTRYYKDAEQSGPGAPTLPACTSDDGEEAGGHLKCAGPNLDQTPARHRGRRSGSAILMEGDVGATLAFKQGLGVHPPGAVVNENGNAYSTINMGLPIENGGAADVEVTCKFYVSAKDYRGVPFVNQSESLSTVAASNAVVVSVPAGGSATCMFAVGRESYKKFAATAFDNAVEMSADEKAFMLDLVVVATGSNGQASDPVSIGFAGGDVLVLMQGCTVIER